MWEYHDDDFALSRFSADYYFRIFKSDDDFTGLSEKHFYIFVFSQSLAYMIESAADVDYHSRPTLTNRNSPWIEKHWRKKCLIFSRFSRVWLIFNIKWNGLDVGYIFTRCARRWKQQWVKERKYEEFENAHWMCNSRCILQTQIEIWCHAWMFVSLINQRSSLDGLCILEVLTYRWETRDNLTNDDNDSLISKTKQMDFSTVIFSPHLVAFLFFVRSNPPHYFHISHRCWALLCCVADWKVKTQMLVVFIYPNNIVSLLLIWQNNNTMQTL